MDGKLELHRFIIGGAGASQASPCRQGVEAREISADLEVRRELGLDRFRSTSEKKPQWRCGW